MCEVPLNSEKKKTNKPLLEPNVDFVFVLDFFLCGTIVCGNLIAKPKMRVEFAAFWISDFHCSSLPLAYFSH